MPRPNINEYFLQMLPLVASRATCPRRQVGCILTDLDGHVLATGYNGVPRGFDHCSDEHPCPGRNDTPGNTSSCRALHAEANAILNCLDLSRVVVAYCSCLPCFECAKMMANTQISKVFCIEDYADKRGLEILLEAGCVVVIGDKTYGMEIEEEP